MLFCDGCSFFLDSTVKVRLLSCGHFICDGCSKTFTRTSVVGPIICKVCQQIHDGGGDSRKALTLESIMTSSRSQSPTTPTSPTPDIFETHNNLNYNNNETEKKIDLDDLSQIGWFREDDDLMNEVEDILVVERKRLEKVIAACDQLKQEYSRRICILPLDEAEECKQRISEMKKEYITMTSGTFDELSDGVLAVRRQLTDIHESVKVKHDLANAFDGSAITFGIETTSKHFGHNAELKTSYEPWKPECAPQLLVVGHVLQELHSDWYTQELNRLEAMPHDEETVYVSTPSPNQDSKRVDSPFFGSSSPSPPPTPRGISAALKNTGAIPKATVVPAKSSSTTAAQSWSQMAKQNCPPPPIYVPRMERTVAETNRPHCYLDIQIRKMAPKRVVIKLRPDKAPFMSDNFIQLCLGSKGFGYKGSRIFRALPNNHVVAGDFEHNNGSGGYSAMDGAKHFTAEQCPLSDQKSAIRMRGMERTPDGRCKVGSQFMVWVGDIEFKTFKHTLVFGNVVEGLSHLQEVSRIGTFLAGKDTWLLKEEVLIVNCGVL